MNMIKNILHSLKQVIIYSILFITVPGVAVCKLSKQNNPGEAMFLRMTINIAYYTKIFILIILYYYYNQA